MECGRYNPAWKDLHMMPEESLKAALDIGTQAYLPKHWGGFTLSFHIWKESVEQSLQEADKQGLEFVSPQIDEMVDLESELPKDRW